MDDVIVCRCMNVSEADVIKYTEKHPKWSTKKVAIDLKIGSRCSCCIGEDCQITDKHFKEVLSEIK